VATLASGVVLAAVALVLLGGLAEAGQLDPSRWAMFTDVRILRFLLDGLGTTLLVGLVSTVLSAVTGVLLALGRLSRSRVVGLPSTAVIEFFRAMPLLLILFFVMFGMPVLGVRLPLFWQLVLAIVVHSGAIFAEIVRAGILAIGRGQSEAATALGLRRWEVMAFVVLPQAVRALAPALVAQAVRVVKESSLGYVVGLTELLQNGRILGEFSGNFLQACVGVAAIYVVVNTMLSRVAERLAGRRVAPASTTQERS
jgi:glutamate transport system permease protein